MKVMAIELQKRSPELNLLCSIRPKLWFANNVEVIPSIEGID
jgi:hypothetical protein